MTRLKSLRSAPNRSRVEIVEVRLSDRSYPVIIGSGLRSAFPKYFKQYGSGRPFWVTDQHVAELWGKELRQLCSESPAELIVLPAGESQKKLATVEKLCRTLAKLGVERGDTLVACGGGVIGDLVGFTAACYMRGIAFVQVPTTLLAMVDASVGGKTGVDLPEGKNLVGAFHQPKLVLTDVDFLTTLPRREINNGFAEVVKTALIGSPSLFSYLQLHGEQRFTTTNFYLHVIPACVTFKAGIVARDEKETGLRRLLNFGHTLGHAWETLGGYRRLKHGEAVFWGMQAAVQLSEKMRLLKTEVAAQIHSYLLPLLREIPVPKYPSEDVIAQLNTDKKVRAGQWHFVLLENIGKPVVTDTVSLRNLKEVLSRFTET